MELQIRKSCTLQAFCREHQLDPTKYSMYIECEKFQKVRKIEDVILMDKVVEQHGLEYVVHCYCTFTVAHSIGFYKTVHWS